MSKKGSVLFIVRWLVGWSTTVYILMSDLLNAYGFNSVTNTSLTQGWATVDLVFMQIKV